MFHSDANINLSVERANERRQAVQAYGYQRGTEAAPSFGQIAEGAPSGGLALRLGAALLVVIVLVVLVVAL